MEDCSTANSNLTYDPLKSDVNIAALKAFEDIIRTSIGPRGKLKVVQNAAGGNVTVTSSSQRLLSIISIHNTFLKLIVSSVKSHLKSFGNYGLICALLILKLINNSFSLAYPFPLIGKLYEYIGKIFINCLNIEDNSCILNIEFDKIGQLQSVVQGILQSKPGCILTADDIKHLSHILIKAYINSIPSSTVALFKNISFISLEGVNCAQSQLYDGLLIKYSGMPVRNLDHLNSRSSLKIVLFTISLSGDADFPVDTIEINSDVSLWETVLKYLKDAMKRIIEAEVDILACQKVVHPSIKKQLEDSGILVLDRLGAESAKNLQYLTGSSNTSLCGEISFGNLTSIQKEVIGKKEFLLLANNQKSFSTILICNFNEQAVNETQIVCQQAINTLYSLLKTPSICYGAGCMEIYTSRLVERKVLECIDAIKEEIECSKHQIFEVLQIFSKSITDIALSIHQGTVLEFVTERTYNHLWKLNVGNFPEKNDCCMCGKYVATEINNSDWVFLNKTLSNLALTTDTHSVKFAKTVNQSAILDDLNSKTNAFSVAFETATLLLRVSVCISS